MVSVEPFRRKDCHLFQCAMLFKKVCCAWNDFQLLDGVYLLKGFLIQVDDDIILSAYDKEDRGLNLVQIRARSPSLQNNGPYL